MSYTDPSGYFSFSKLFSPLLRPLIKASSKVFGSTWTNIVGNILFYKLGGPLGSAYWSYNFTRAMGGTSSGALRGAFTAAASAFVFQQIGQQFEGSGFFAEGGVGHIAAHAVTGGVIADLQGGKFGHGFFSAGLTKAANVNGIIGTSQAAGMDAVRIVTAAVIGGTISKATGGKFANGATTAAFAQAFNGNPAARRRAQAQRIANQNRISGRFQTIERLKATMVPGDLRFGIRPLGDSGIYTVAGDPLLNVLDLELAHEHIVYMDENGELQNIGFTGKKSGVSPDSNFEGRISTYKFGPIQHVDISKINFWTLDFHRSRYNFITNNCQDYCTFIRKQL